jgi:hypothetical protein
VERVDPRFAGVAELRQTLGEEADLYTVRGGLGINRRLRVKRDAGLLTKVLFWAPNRAFDLLDLVTFDVHVGLGAFANLHVTRALQVGAGLRGIVGVGAHDQRILGLNNEAEMGVAVLGLGTEMTSGSAIGIPGGVATGADAMAGLHRPSSRIYQDFRDYWAIGAGATAGLAGADVDLHPVQLFDFLLGIFFVDFARDDFGTTRRMRLDNLDYQLLRSLNNVERADTWQGGADEEAAATE